MWDIIKEIFTTRHPYGCEPTHMNQLEYWCCNHQYTIQLAIAVIMIVTIIVSLYLARRDSSPKFKAKVDLMIALGGNNGGSPLERTNFFLS